MALELTINGKEITLDFLDVDTMEQHEKAMQMLQDSPYLRGEGGQDLEMVKGVCALTYDFFDTLLGEGKGNVIFDGKRNIGVCMRAVNTYLQKYHTYIDGEFERELQELKADISPQKAVKPENPKEMMKQYLEDEEFLQVISDFVKKKRRNGHESVVAAFA